MNRIGLDVVGKGRQGLRRRIDTEALRKIDLVAALARIGVPASEAVALVADLPEAETSSIQVAPFLSLAYDRRMHLADLDHRLREATERVIPRRRGRPPTR